MTIRQIVVSAAWVIGALAVLLVTLVPAPTLEPTSAPNSAEDIWSLPRLPLKRDAEADLMALTRSGLWGGQFNVESQGDDRSKRWRLAGIAGQGRDRQALVKLGDERMIPLKVGDQFPDGTAIVDIKQNGVCVMVDGKKRFLPIPGQTPPMVW